MKKKKGEEAEAFCSFFLSDHCPVSFYTIHLHSSSSSPVPVSSCIHFVTVTLYCSKLKNKLKKTRIWKIINERTRDYSKAKGNESHQKTEKRDDYVIDYFLISCYQTWFIRK